MKLKVNKDGDVAAVDVVQMITTGVAAHLRQRYKRGRVAMDANDSFLTATKKGGHRMLLVAPYKHANVQCLPLKKLSHIKIYT
jgi:hypothetical protein